MTCTVAQRRLADRVAARLEGNVHVVDATVLDPDDSRRDRWTLDVALDSERGAPPLVARRIGASGGWVVDASPQGEHYIVAVTL